MIFSPGKKYQRVTEKSAHVFLPERPSLFLNIKFFTVFFLNNITWLNSQCWFINKINKLWILELHESTHAKCKMRVYAVRGDVKCAESRLFFIIISIVIIIITCHLVSEGWCVIFLQVSLSSANPLTSSYFVFCIHCITSSIYVLLGRKEQVYWRPIRSRIRAFDWCQNQRPWM